MRMRGLEPPRPERHTDLNRARLPIPPHPRAGILAATARIRHAARQPPFRIGVIPNMNRVFALLGAVGLCCLALPAAPPGTRQRLLRRASAALRTAARSSSRSRLPRSRAGPESRGRAAHAAIDREQARFAAALHESDPERADPLALPARAQRRRRRRPEQRATAACRRSPACGRSTPERRLHGRARPIR